MKATTDAWITFEDEEDEEEEGGDGWRSNECSVWGGAGWMEEETDFESDGEDLNEIFELF